MNKTERRKARCIIAFNYHDLKVRERERERLICILLCTRKEQAVEFEMTKVYKSIIDDERKPIQKKT